MDDMEDLNLYRSMSFTGATELANSATEILRTAEWYEVGRTADSSSAYPTERQIRYFEKLGLIPETAERRRNAPVYGWPHLLLLLNIKKLQSSGLSSGVIKKILENKSGSELESLLVERVLIFSDSDELNSFIKQNGTEEGEQVMRLWDASEIEVPRPTKNNATEFLESLLFNKPRTSDRRSPLVMPVPSAASIPNIGRRVEATSDSLTPKPKVWARIEIEPGIELHIEQNHHGLSTVDQRSLLIKAIEKVIRQLP